MSQLLIQHYLNDLQTLRRVSGTSRESVVREAFKTLLKNWGRSRDLIFIPEFEYTTLQKKTVYPDGALVYALRVPLGYWEAKDEEDKLDDEIEKKFRKGYPQDNIIFEDSHQAVLIQNKREVMRCGVEESALQKLLELFFGYEPEVIVDFRKAVEQFKSDLPAVLKALREMIDDAEKQNEKFRKAAIRFLKHAQDTINPSVTAADVREMLIQHILTEEIFSQVFDNADFHRRNNVAKELYALEGTFFIGKVKHDTLAGLRHYYAAIKSAAALVPSHHEKQNFLKIIYENFYKVYNKKAADRLGVVYTPNEIVRFMIESADWLCEKHFGKSLIDNNVEILDPAVGTGTFITELIEHFRGQPEKLRYKYLEELHANEVAILPYYVANLNIEATYAAINGYEEYPNLCFVDTLDNTAALRAQRGQQTELFGGVTEENVARIKRQNKKKISVIIGNPPYNANQLNENENNKNREYPQIDGAIGATYIESSDAQKTKLYDMYVRFFRWASDRIDENGIVAFVSNSSYIHKPSFDGFRKCVAKDFNEIWTVDLKGDARTSGERRRREGGNIFGDQIKVGIAISFFVKKQGTSGCRIRYEAVRDYAKADEKSEFLRGEAIGARHFEELKPDKKANWISLTGSDFESFLPIADKSTKATKIAGQECAIFRLYSLGISTNRDEWLYDLEPRNLEKKIGYFIAQYDAVKPGEEFPDHIKWSETLKRRQRSKQREAYSKGLLRRANYRPFFSIWLYQSPLFIDRPGLADTLFPVGEKNLAICFSDVGSRTDYCVQAIDGIADLHFGAAVDAYQQVPRYSFVGGARVDNITDWALDQFRAHYTGPRKVHPPIVKDAIFHYVYAILYDPIYREQYAPNLKREFPRIPFYADFWKWATWGEKLMALHIGYEAVEPWPVERIDAADAKSRGARLTPRLVLKADKENGNIQLDSETQLVGVPPEAWTYRLGNRSALEWILDQYKEKTPKDPTIREKFNTYRFADHKEKVINLLMRVTRVSVETMAIVEAMKKEKR
jgi:predicted helicase